MRHADWMAKDTFQTLGKIVSITFRWKQRDDGWTPMWYPSHMAMNAGHFPHGSNEDLKRQM